jgi:hypothetical protein
MSLTVLVDRLKMQPSEDNYSDRWQGTENATEYFASSVELNCRRTSDEQTCLSYAPSEISRGFHAD